MPRERRVDARAGRVCGPRLRVDGPSNGDREADTVLVHGSSPPVPGRAVRAVPPRCRRTDYARPKRGRLQVSVFATQVSKPADAGFDACRYRVDTGFVAGQSRVQEGWKRRALRAVQTWTMRTTADEVAKTDTLAIPQLQGLRASEHGGGGIRTHETLAPNGFQDRPVRPLRHPAGAHCDRYAGWTSAGAPYCAARRERRPGSSRGSRGAHGR